MEVRVARVKSNPSNLKWPEFALEGRWLCTHGSQEFHAGHVHSKKNQEED